MSPNETDVISQNGNLENKSKKGGKNAKPKYANKNLEKEINFNVNGENTKIEEVFSNVKKSFDHKDQAATRTNILYNLHKKIIRHRQELQTQGEQEKVEKDYSECTFTPILSLTENYKKLFESTKKTKNIANENYVEKKKKQRESLNALENHTKNKIGSGNNWTKEPTIPNYFNFKTHSRSALLNNTINNFSTDMKDSKNENIKVISSF
jgi:hypothetical protein